MKPATAGSIARNSAFDSGAQIAIVLYSMVAGVILARALGNEGRGVFVYSTIFIPLLFFGFCNLGVDLAATVYTSKKPASLPVVHGTIVAGCLALALVLNLLIFVFGDALSAHVFPGAAPGTLMLAGIGVPMWVYLYGIYAMLVGLGRVRTRAMLDMGFNALQLTAAIAILLLVRDKGATISWLIASCYAIMIVYPLFAATLLPRRAIRMPSARFLRRFYGYGFWIYFGNLGTNLSQRADQYFLDLITRSSGAFGIYTLASGLAGRTRILPQALSRSTYAAVCKLPEREAAQLTAASCRQMMLMGGVCLAGAIAVAPLVPLIYSSDFAAAGPLLIVFVGGRLFHNAAWMIANYFTGHLERPKIPLAINWVLLPIQIVASLVALYNGGLMALALVTSGMYICLYVVFVCLFLRQQQHAGLADLLIPRREDFAKWLGLVRGIRRRI